MNSQLAIDGGRPVRDSLLPYSRQSIDARDVDAVAQVLQSDMLTTGPEIRKFERAFAKMTGAAEAVAVSSGTAALHAAMHGLDIGPGDEVIVPSLTFAASANCVVYQGATPIFADVDETMLLIDPADAERKISPRTRAIIAVDYAGQACDYTALRDICDRHSLALVADACHSLGGSYQGRPVGSLADLNVFSLHPVKAMTTGEGGVVTLASFNTAHRLRCFRNHGITTDHLQRARDGSWLYEMVELGYNYRLSDFQCALGMSQLERLPTSTIRRQAIARHYDAALTAIPGLAPLHVRADVSHAYHLYVVRIDAAATLASRGEIFSALRAEGIGVNVHYLPVHLHPFYRGKFATGPGQCPRAEAAYETILSLPIFPAMTERDVDDVIEALWKVMCAYAGNTRAATAISAG